MEWMQVMLGDVCDHLRNGASIKQSKGATGVPITRIQTISFGEIDTEKFGYAHIHNDKYSRWYLQDGDILLSHINSEQHIGKVALYTGSPAPLIHGMNLLCLRPKRGAILPKWLLYMLRSEDFRALLPPITKRAVNQASISTASLKRLPVRVPPPSEQRRIVEILDQADGLRKQRAEADKLAARILPALFYKMFGDPATNPKGWDKVKLGDISTKITDGTHQPPPFVDSGIPFLFVQNIVSGVIDFSTRKFISADTYVSLTARTKPERGDILYSTVGSYGVAVEVKTDREFAFQRHIGHIKPDHSVVNASFLTAQLNTPFVRSQADQRARGVAQKTLNLSELREFEIINPPIKVQNLFSEHVEQSRENTEARLINKNRLESLFSTLLHLSFSGDLTSKWREAHMKELLQEMAQQAKELNIHQGT